MPITVTKTSVTVTSMHDTCVTPLSLLAIVTHSALTHNILICIDITKYYYW